MTVVSVEMLGRTEINLVMLNNLYFFYSLSYDVNIFCCSLDHKVQDIYL